MRGFSMNANPTAPFSSAINTYATLKGVDRADEELKLRQAENERAGRREARDAEAAAINMETARFSLGQAKEGAEREKLTREDQGFLARIQTGSVTDEDRKKYPEFFDKANGLPSWMTFDEEAPIYDWSWQNAARFAEDLGNLPPSPQKQLIIDRDPSNPGREKLFYSMIGVSGGPKRLGGEHEYPVYNRETGQQEGTVKGKVGFPAALLYDRERDAVGMLFTVLDENGVTILGPDGRPLTVPATENRSSDPDDPVKLVPRASIPESAKVARSLIADARQVRSSLKPGAEDQALARIAQRGGPQGEKALQAIETHRTSTQTVAALQGELARAKPGSAQEQQLRTAIDLVGKTRMEVDKALGVGAITAAPLATEEATKRVREQKTWEDKQPLSQAERDKLAEERKTRLAVAGVEAGKIAATDARQDKTLAYGLYKDALNDLAIVEGKLSKEYNDPQNASARRMVTANGKVRRISEEEYYWGSPAWKRANAEMTSRKRALMRLAPGGGALAFVPAPISAGTTTPAPPAARPPLSSFQR